LETSSRQRGSSGRTDRHAAAQAQAFKSAPIDRVWELIVRTVESPHRHLKVEGTGRLNRAVTSKDVRPGDVMLAPVWEWGYTELSYNPDTGGFRRIKSD
jgi:hypothetical protein